MKRCLNKRTHRSFWALIPSEIQWTTFATSSELSLASVRLRVIWASVGAFSWLTSKILKLSPLSTIANSSANAQDSTGSFLWWQDSVNWSKAGFVESKLVFGSPVRSGFLAPSALDRNRNRSSQFQKQLKTGPNRDRPVFCGLLAVTRPVLTGSGLNWFLTSLDRSCGVQQPQKNILSI